MAQLMSAGRQSGRNSITSGSHISGPAVFFIVAMES